MKDKRNVTVTSIEKTALAPFEAEVKKANRDLELARDRACMQATPRSRGEGSVAYINERLPVSEMGSEIYGSRQPLRAR